MDHLERRLEGHKKGRVKFASQKRPWVLVATEFFIQRPEARWIKSSLKRSRGKRLEWLDKNKLKRA